ncbi:Protein of unknown function, partial [Cotesia congregata]
AYTVDVMHDMLEGVVQREIHFIIELIVKKKILTLDIINTRIQEFNFGSIEMKNRPSPIVLKQSGLIGQRAAQT